MQNVMFQVTQEDTFLFENNAHRIYIVAYDLMLTIPVLTGNVLIILVFGLYMPMQQRHSHIFIINMAVADFFVGLALPFKAAFHLDHYLLSDKYACFGKFTLIATALGQSIFSLTAISLDRFIAIFYPLKYEIHVTRARVVVLLIISWATIVGTCAMTFAGKYNEFQQCISFSVDNHQFTIICGTFLASWGIFMKINLFVKSSSIMS